MRWSPKTGQVVKIEFCSYNKENIKEQEIETEPQKA
jgi:hypothetical protein